MWRLKPKILLWGMVLALKKVVESVVIVFVLMYVVLVFDIYINTEKLSEIDSSLNFSAKTLPTILILRKDL